MWVLLLILAAVAFVTAQIAAGSARHRREPVWEGLFTAAFVMAAFLMGAALQWGLG